MKSTVLAEINAKVKECLAEVEEPSRPRRSGEFECDRTIVVGCLRY